jgi:hypothetical protein
MVLFNGQTAYLQFRESDDAIHALDPCGPVATTGETDCSAHLLSVRPDTAELVLPIVRNAGIINNSWLQPLAHTYTYSSFI